MFEINDEELDAVKKVLLSRKLFRYQGKTQETECSLFESEFSTYLGTAFTQLVSSGTNSLFLALKLLGIGKGDEVIVPCYTFFATPLAVLQTGATPVIVNVDDHLCLSVKDAESRITGKTRAIIGVHMDGFQCDMNALLELWKKYQIPIIEDVAQATGGSYFGQKLGSMGDFGSFSFNVEKIITAGEGGALTSRENSQKLKALVLHDTAAQFGITHKDELSSLPLLGYSMRVSEITGALMRVQLRKLEMILANLRARKSLILNELNSDDVVSPLDPKGECATTLHLKVADPMAAVDISRDLVSQNVKAIPLMVRPAHFYWQWSNHLKLSEEEFKRLSKSRMFLSSLLRVNVPYDLPVEDTLEQGRIIRKVLEKWSLK